MKKNFSLLLSLLITVVPLLSPLSRVLAYNQTTALNYLAANSSNPWSTMAQAALNTPSISGDYLKTISGDKAIDYEAPILAITALNQDPRTFGSVDYISKLENFHTAEQIGDPATLNDDIFGILALVSAGQPLNDSAIIDTKNFVLGHENSDGGWGFSPYSASDSNTTASAIVALMGSGLNASDNHIQNGINYLKTTQNNDGGFTYDPNSIYGTDSDSSSTAWVMWAINALGQNQSTWTKNGHTPADYLSTTQTASGYFQFKEGSGEDSFSPTTTAYAAIALAGKTLPLHTITANSSNQTFGFRIEGSQDTVCVGQAAGPTALDVVKNAQLMCGFSYHIKDSTYGPYLDKINQDQASGLTGWLYFVNNISPDIGAGDYQLKPSDEVLWYFGDFGWKPSRLTLSPTTVATGQSGSATVEYFSNNSWQALSGASVIAGTAALTTDAAGLTYVGGPDGYYKVFAQKTGYIRSNRVLLKIGDPSSSSIALSANITAGQVNGTSTKGSTISFIIDSSSLDFGSLLKGENKTKQVKITNNGSSNLHFESIVSGDNVFVDNISIQSKPWQTFKTDINSGQNQTEDVKLTVPQNYSGSSGAKSGQLVLWATGQ